jgi:hypothetical protein
MKTDIFKLKFAIFFLGFIIGFTSCEKQFLTVDETPVTVSSAGGEYFIKVKSNEKWSAVVEDAQNRKWCILSNYIGTGDGAIIVNIAQNTDSLIRNVVVKITSGKLVKSVVINQAGKDIDEEPFLTVDETPIDVAIAGGEHFIKVKSNVSWSATIEDTENKDWCTLSNNSGTGDGTITMRIALNTDSLMRNAVIKITSGELVKSVVINQAGTKPFLTTEDRFIMMESVNGKYFITVKSNKEWTATVENAANRNWCTLSNSNGIGDGKITVHVPLNTATLMRGAVVKIVSGELIQSVLVCQNVNISSDITCDWDYPIKPGMPEWASSGGVAACQIPDSILNDLSTACLTKICLQYPFIYDMFVFNDKRKGFDMFFRNFNGIRELYNREEVLEELLKQYHNLINDMSTLDGGLSGNIGYVWSISALEMLLYGYSQKVDASVENYTTVLLYLTIGYEKKLKYEDVIRGAGFSGDSNLFSRANIIVKIKPETATSFSYALWGSVMIYTETDIINELSYELIK